MTTLQQIRERDALWCEASDEWAERQHSLDRPTANCIVDRRHLLSLVERMRPYVVMGGDYAPMSKDDELKYDALLEELK